MTVKYAVNVRALKVRVALQALKGQFFAGAGAESFFGVFDEEPFDEVDGVFGDDVELSEEEVLLGRSTPPF